MKTTKRCSFYGSFLFLKETKERKSEDWIVANPNPKSNLPSWSWQSCRVHGTIQHTHVLEGTKHTTEANHGPETTSGPNNTDSWHLEVLKKIRNN